MGIWEEGRDYATVAASQTKASLGPGAKTSDGDVIHRVVITPATTSPGAVTLYDGSSGTGMVIFPGGASSVVDLKAIYIDLNMRAKNPGASTNGPRWLISTGANISVIAIGTFH